MRENFCTRHPKKYIKLGRKRLFCEWYTQVNFCLDFEYKIKWEAFQERQTRGQGHLSLRVDHKNIGGKRYDKQFAMFVW